MRVDYVQLHVFINLEMKTTGNILSNTDDICILCKNLTYYRPQTKFAKAMFLHVSVCPRGMGVSRPTARGSLRGLAGGSPGPHRGGAGGIPACTEADPPPTDATAADGTQPTGMHSCFIFMFTRLGERSYFLFFQIHQQLQI